MSETTNIGLLVGGFPLQLLHSLVFCIEDYDTFILLLLIKLLLMLLDVSKYNRHAPNGIACVLPFILLRDVDFSMGPSDF